MNPLSEARATLAYAGRRITLLTQHGKESAIAPVLEPAIGCRIERVAGYDTDLLGTFTREIPRFGTQLDAARNKARIGMKMAGARLGLASEGSFGHDPYTGMFSWNVEILLFIDDTLEIEVWGIHQGPDKSEHLHTHDWAAVEAFAGKAGFPAQHLVLRPNNERDLRYRKGISDWLSLHEAFSWAQSLSDEGRVFVEFDLRAYANPARMDNIRRAAEDLAIKLASPCPACSSPGYALIDQLTGLRCAACGEPTREPRADIWGCVRCNHRETRARPDAVAADPGRCDRCNP